MTELVTDGLSYWARQAPGRPAIVFDGTDRVDYLTLDRWTDAAAHAHAAAGLRAGERIGIIGDNSLEWVVAAIGALKLGAVVVPFNNRFTPDELRYLVDDAGPVISSFTARFIVHAFHSPKPMMTALRMLCVATATGAARANAKSIRNRTIGFFGSFSPSLTEGSASVASVAAGDVSALGSAAALWASAGAGAGAGAPRFPSSLLTATPK